MQTITFNASNWTGNEATAQVSPQGRSVVFNEERYIVAIKDHAATLTLVGSEYPTVSAHNFGGSDWEAYDGSDYNNYSVSRDGSDHLVAMLQVLANIS